MSFENPYALAFFASGLVVLGAMLLGFAVRRRSHVSREYLLLTGAVATHTLAYALELSSITLEQKVFFHRVVWLGLATTPTAALLLALRFTRKTAGHKVTVSLLAVSAATVLLAWTSGYHDWLEGPPSLIEHGGYLLRHQERGPFLWVFLFYASACALGALGICGATWLSGSPLERRQARMLFFAMLAPWVLNFAFIVEPTPIRLTPLALGLSALVLTWAIFRDGFLDLVPVARETVIELIGEPLFILDRRGRVVDANPAACALLPGPFTAGAPARELLPVLDREYRSGGGAERVTLGARTFELRWAPITAGGRVVTLYDVTVRQARERATREALSARSEFIARMSHELRTPLQGVLGSLELLERTGLRPAQGQHVETARRSAHVLLALVDDVLDFEREERGLVLEAEPVDVRGLVDDVVMALSATARLKGITIEGEVRADAPGLPLGDPRRLRQIVLNLAANAVKFTPRGGVRVVAETGRASGGCAVSFRVIDTGPGIPEASLPRMFEPFTRLEGPRAAHEGDGVGLGLAICRRLATAMDGHLTLENRAGGGLVASFAVTLPFAPAAEASPDPSGKAGQDLRTRVLLVEDHPVSRAVVTQMLEGLGAQVSAVDTGRDALAHASSTPFDVALVDLHLPDMDGLRVVRALRASALPPNVVVFTADERPGLKEACREAGANGVLLKPASSEELARALRKAASATTPEGPPPRVQLLQAFVQTWPGELIQLRRAFEAGDHPACDEVLHGLLGAAAMLGLTEVTGLCRAAQGRVTPEAIARLQAACEAASRTETRAVS